MAWKTFIKDYLIFSKKERIASLVIIFILLFIYILPRLFSKSAPLALQEDSLLLKSVDTLQHNASKSREENLGSSSKPYYPASRETKGFVEGELFRFDPNTLPAEGWQKLGLNDRTIRILINYRNKGGRFYKPEDLKKVWTMPVGFYNRVKDLVSIPPLEKASYPTFTSTQYSREEKRINPVNINEADTAAFIALPGIGPVLAGRIINFRNKLGGFYSVNQVGETYGLPESTFQKLHPYFIMNEQEVRKININTATKDELAAHPYINWKLANAMVEYRSQHGLYRSLEDLENIIIMDDTTFNKIRNYLFIE